MNIDVVDINPWFGSLKTEVEPGAITYEKLTGWERFVVWLWLFLTEGERAE